MGSSSRTHQPQPLSRQMQIARAGSAGLIGLALCGVLLAGWPGAVIANPVQQSGHVVVSDTYQIWLPLMAQSFQAGEGLQLTFDPGNDTQPALSPDGNTVVFLSDRASQTDIFSVSTAGGQATNLSHTPLAQEDTPVYSPDGTKIAFASNRSGDWDIYLMDADGANVQRTIGYTGATELQPAFTPDGSALLFSSNLVSGNWDIYSATLGSEAVSWIRLTTDPEPDRFPSISADGTTIAFRSERDGNSEIYVMDANGSHQRRVTNNPAFDGYPSLAPDGSGIAFTSWRTGVPQVYSVNLGGTGLITWTTRSNWAADHPRLSSAGRRLVYAARSMSGTFDVFVRPFDTPLYTTAERGAAPMPGKCDWEAGTLALGLAQAWRATGDDEYGGWLRNWINTCIPATGAIDHVNDGLLGYAALIAYESQGRPEQLAFAQKVANYFVYTATRTADGTLTHEDDTVWDDTLLGTVPFLAEMSRVSGNTAYLDEAVTQTLKHAGHLQDPASGLYHHAWDESRNAYWSASYWARGNSWVLLADIELLSSMPVTHPQRAAILNLLRKQAAGLKPLQDVSGRWHTVVNRPDFYLESSGSAIIGYAMRRAVQAGWLNVHDYEPGARAALLGMWREVLSDGRVSEVSAPTGPLLTEIEYNEVPNNSMQLYGQGALLLLASP
jgi:rhamnogalacturonyl hydrolase YesR/Tol biopolymer transport system component